MKYISLKSFCIICLLPLMSCAQDNKIDESSKAEKAIEKTIIKKQEPHRYGGWYCPDNLNGFPAVDIRDWKDVPVVNGRMATKEETQNGTSLINVDLEKYPNAKPLDIKMPKLARFYNRSSRKEEIIIVIQALNISNDSIVGFRYLNGGNGSARMDKVEFLSPMEIAYIAPSRFVSFSIEIDATQEEIWEVITKAKYSKKLQAIFDKENTLPADWNNSSYANYKYLKRGNITAEYADKLYGNLYVQIDSELGDNQYVEKFLLLENEETKKTELKITCGPYGSDFETQEAILNKWALKVKKLSE